MPHSQPIGFDWIRLDSTGFDWEVGDAEAECCGGGIVASEHIRCEYPFLHEGMSTTLDGTEVGNRLQLVTDPDWFNAGGAARIVQEQQQQATSPAA